MLRLRWLQSAPMQRVGSYRPRSPDRRGAAMARSFEAVHEFFNRRRAAIKILPRGPAGGGASATASSPRPRVPRCPPAPGPIGERARRGLRGPGHLLHRHGIPAGPSSAGPHQGGGRRAWGRTRCAWPTRWRRGGGGGARAGASSTATSSPEKRDAGPAIRTARSTPRWWTSASPRLKEEIIGSRVKQGRTEEGGTILGSPALYGARAVERREPGGQPGGRVCARGDALMSA